MRARAPIGVLRQVLKASLALATAALISSGVAKGTRARTSWVAGLITSRHWSVLDSMNSPLMRSLMVGILLLLIGRLWALALVVLKDVMDSSSAFLQQTIGSFAPWVCIYAQCRAGRVMDWDNLRFFLELSRAGRLTAAARRLGVDHTTVSRRLQALEKSLGVALFIRDTNGYTLTEAGRSLLPQVELMEGASVRIEQALPSPGDSLSGQVRIGATEGYGTMLVAGQLSELSQRHPDLNLDLLALPRAVRLSRHEADIVITLERPERGPFIITKLSDYVLRLYAGKDYLEAHGPINSRSDLEKHRFVSYVDDLVFSKDLLFLDEIAGSGAVGVRSTSVLAQQEAIAAGAGLGILPAFTADQDPRLSLIMPTQIRFIRTFWMLMPIELKDIARMRVTWDFLREQAERERGRLMGMAG